MSAIERWVELSSVALRYATPQILILAILIAICEWGLWLCDKALAAAQSGRQ